MNGYKSSSLNIKGFTIFKSVILGAAVTFSVMLVLSLLMLWFGVSDALSVPFATISVASGSMVAAFYAARKNGSKGYLIGLLVGVITFLVVTVISLVVSGGALSSNTLFRFVIIVISSLIGGILGINLHREKKYI